MRDLSRFRDKLEARLAELTARVQDIENSLEEPAPKDWEDRAVEREGDEVMEGLSAAGKLEIELIRAALRRFDEGTYGECLTCGDDIAEARLDAVPHAPLCHDCAGAGAR